MTSTAKTTRTPAQLRALRRFAMTWAWDQAYHVVSCYAPGTKNVAAEARRLLARGWVEAKLAERHGHLVVVEAEPVNTPAPQPIATVHVLRAQIEDLENTDRLGWAGMQRLGALKIALHTAEARAA